MNLAEMEPREGGEEVKMGGGGTGNSFWRQNKNLIPSAGW